MWLQQPGNDFAWSRWKTETESIDEIERWISKVKLEELGSTLEMKVLFAPTGPIQEVSLSSGWGDEFLRLADRFDQALE